MPTRRLAWATAFAVLQIGCQQGASRSAADSTPLRPMVNNEKDAFVTLENDEAYRQASERAQNIAMVSMGFINMVAGLASPRVWAKLEQMPAREELLRCADAYIDALASVRPSHPERGSMEATKPHAIKLRKLLDTWTPSRELPLEIVQCARELLSAFAIPEPPGGWDNFEGFDEDE